MDLIRINIKKLVLYVNFEESLMNLIKTIDNSNLFRYINDEDNVINDE